MPSLFFSFVRFFGDHDDSLRGCNFAVSCSTFVHHDDCSSLRFFPTFPRPVQSANVPHVPTSSDVLVRHYYSFHRVLFPRLPALLFSSDEFSFSLPPFLYLGVLVFQRFRWALDSACDAFKLILRYRDLTLSTLGVPLIAPVGPISSIRGFHVADHWRHIDRPYISHVAYYGI